MTPTDRTNSPVPAPIATDTDDVVWSLRAAAVKHAQGDFDDAFIWVTRAVKAALDAQDWSRADTLARAGRYLEGQAAISGLFRVVSADDYLGSEAELPSHSPSAAILALEAHHSPRPPMPSLPPFLEDDGEDDFGEIIDLAALGPASSRRHTHSLRAKS
jgi:hypothetical protein